MAAGEDHTVRPLHGPGAIAGLGDRIVAFVLDALLCNLVAWGLVRDGAWVTPVFVLEVLVLTLLGGASAGQRIRGLRVVRRDGGPAGAAPVLLRTALLLLVVPALLIDRDGVGLHDRAARTLLVRTR